MHATNTEPKAQSAYHVYNSSMRMTVIVSELHGQQQQEHKQQ